MKFQCRVSYNGVIGLAGPSVAMEVATLTTPSTPILSLCVCGDPLCVIPYGLCHCGCERQTTISKQNHKLHGWIKGAPLLYVRGHIGKKPIPLSERFWNFVNKNGPIVREELGPCWIWTGAVNDHGYGVVWDGKAPCLAHRASWILSHGVIDDAMNVCHCCDNPPCVNSEHLFLGDHLANMQDMAKKGRAVVPGLRGEQCYNAKFTEENVREIRASGLSRIESLRFFSQKFNVSESAVSNVLYGAGWKGV